MRGIDLIRVQIERDRLLLALEAARREAAVARIDLFRQMDRPVDLQVELTDKLESNMPIETQTLAVVLTARADVVVAREAVAVAEAQVKLQRALGVPDLDLLEAQRSDQELLQAQKMLVDAEANVHMEREHLSEGLQPGDRIVVKGAFMVKAAMLKGTMGDG